MPRLTFPSSSPATPPPSGSSFKVHRDLTGRRAPSKPPAAPTLQLLETSLVRALGHALERHPAAPGVALTDVLTTNPRSGPDRLWQDLATGPDAFTARLGGDEFAVVLPDRSSERALTVSATLKRVTGTPVEIDGRRLLVGGSIGIAGSTEAADVEELLRNADAAMYRAKSAGEGVQVHDRAASTAAADQAQLLEELKVLLVTPDAFDALDAGQVEVHYQAQVDRDGHVVGVEALARWRHPRLGLLTPDRFLHLVEDYGLCR